LLPVFIFIFIFVFVLEVVPVVAGVSWPRKRVSLTMMAARARRHVG
jgi:hypothetical protein